MEALLVGFMADLSYQSCGMTLHSLDRFLVSSVEWVPYCAAILEMGSDQSFVRQRQRDTINKLERHSNQGQDLSCFCNRISSLSMKLEVIIHCYTQVPF